MTKRILILAAALALLAATVGASAEPRDHGHGHLVVVGGFGGWYGPYWGPGWGWGPYGGPGYWGPGYWAQYPNTGVIKIDSKVKDAEVYVNGAYLGTVGKNRTIHLRPGAYKIEIREPGREPFVSNVYVTVDKTLHLHPEG